MNLRAYYAKRKMRLAAIIGIFIILAVFLIFYIYDTFGLKFESTFMMIGLVALPIGIVILLFVFVSKNLEFSYICPNCLKSIFLKDISSIECPFCGQSDQQGIDSNKWYFGNFLFQKCPKCKGRIQLFPCPKCGSIIDAFKEYDMEITEVQRYE